MMDEQARADTLKRRGRRCARVYTKTARTRNGRTARSWIYTILYRNQNARTGAALGRYPAAGGLQTGCGQPRSCVCRRVLKKSKRGDQQGEYHL